MRDDITSFSIRIYVHMFQIEAEARAQGLVLSRKDLLPANNYALAFTKDGGN